MRKDRLYDIPVCDLCHNGVNLDAADAKDRKERLSSGSGHNTPPRQPLICQAASVTEAKVLHLGSWSEHDKQFDLNVTSQDACKVEVPSESGLKRGFVPHYWNRSKKA